MHARVHLVFGLAVALVAASGLSAGRAAGAEDPWRLCAEAVAAVERAERVPTMLLHAISLAESGRWREDRKATVAWPWTVYAEGTGNFFRSKAEAIAAVERLAARGVRNIDVGCLQVSLLYHGHAFVDLDQAFDPAANATYAVRLLKALRAKVGSWAHAVGRYHNSDWRGRGQPYWRRVYGLWNAELRRAYAERRAARIRANLAAMARTREERLAAR